MKTEEDWPAVKDVWLMLQLGREASDARVEEIARHAESYINAQPYASDDTRRECAGVARSIAAFARSRIQKPKTREQVLEEALRKVANLPPYSIPFDESTTPQSIARNALERKP